MLIEVPGNLLIAGEYAITRPMGIGVAVAVNARLQITVNPSEQLTVSGKYNNTEYRWQEGEAFTDELRLIECAFRALKIFSESRDIESSDIRMDVHIDSSEFFYSDGRKKGFGSSAAVAAGLAYAFLENIFSRAPHIHREVLPLALLIHRNFQGRHGSGYDILASLKGGVGLFTGGRPPTWERLAPVWENDMFLLRGDNAVSTPGALKKFTNFCRKSPHKAEQFFLLSNRVACDFVQADDTKQASEIFHKCSHINHWLHRHLKIESEGPEMKKRLELSRQKGFSAKALGAGGEIAAVLIPGGIEGHEDLTFLEKLHIAEDGITCTL